ncbi:MAG: DNA-3-methyladenine glycosylase 2 family protein [Alphaproteobacteria bacterium]|nr:DNA-3-methyladenine glycosylase 2 family protein [Alphaproteobacteria bacterium]
MNDVPTIVEIARVGRVVSKGCQSLLVTSTQIISRRDLSTLARRLVAADLDLRPFYRVASRHPVLGAIVTSLKGLKPLPPPSLFEMAVIAITEQQLSMTAAFQIRSRLIKRFGTLVDDLHVFPTSERLVHVPLRDLKTCGLSRRKAEYLKGVASRIASGELDLEALSQKTDVEAAAVLVRERGFGDWSAQYFLGRGLGRTDSLPSADVGLRRAIGKYLARGQHLSPSGLDRVLAPFTPFRGLAAFYVAAYARLSSLPRAKWSSPEYG